MALSKADQANWNKIKGTLENFEEEPEYQQVVDEEKEKHRDKSLPELAEFFVGTVKQKAALAQTEKVLNIQKMAADQMLRERMENLGLEKVTVSGGVSLFSKGVVRTSLLDRDLLRDSRLQNRDEHKKMEGRLDALKEMKAAGHDVDGLIDKAVKDWEALGQPTYEESVLSINPKTLESMNKELALSGKDALPGTEMKLAESLGYNGIK